MCKNYHSQKSIKSDNLSLSTSNANSNECSISKSKCLSPTISLATSNGNYESISKYPPSIMEALENTAVHFGDFYGLQNNVGTAYYNNVAEEETAIKKRHRLNFTRQMVHKLERTTDTEDYARQISVFLQETVEPPNFKLNPFLSENSIPDGRRRFSRYPFWYKEPNKKLIVNVLKSDCSN
ncbi:uncharacterized protein LOC126851628 [Cataglyphis hispanica]|uniref:uncharacterized protein LOC126851628 n=1 Tax=Cataglyphis hispanica TaxID=1086592 RepID=UPI0021803BED|nr:uncharacterized protein LOC126851628 [Cataglyphis hispanica]